MKIAILTLPLHTNYGGILQAYALQTVLERMGHTVQVLQKHPGLSHSPWIMPAVYAKRIAGKVFRGSNIPVFAEQKAWRENAIIEQYTGNFIRRHVNLREINHLSDIQPEDYDAIVVGSDQIWRRTYFVKMWSAPIDDAFLSFSQGWSIKRVAYAASFGMDDINEYASKDIIRCARAIKTFDAVSVREDAAVTLCNERLGIKASQMPDPTMLLDKSDYLKLTEEGGVSQSEGDMLCYILDTTPFKDDVINTLSVKHGLTPFHVNVPISDLSIDAGKRIQPPVEQWLRGFNDAHMVVTDSFHACVFSIIFNKPFIAIGNASRGLSRFTSLLSHFGLQERLITETAPTRFPYADDFDWSSVKGNLRNMQEKATVFLKTNLSD